MEFNRRDFLKFMGAAGALSVTGCNFLKPSERFPTFKDELVLADGLNYDMLIKWGDMVGDRPFGFNPDYIAFLKQSDGTGLMWVNHEYPTPLFVSGKERTLENVQKEREVVGGSVLHVKKNEKWEIIKDSPYNRRIDANTKFTFAGGIKVDGTNDVVGTLGNCAGGVTPWGNILTCEENSDQFMGWPDYKTKGTIPSSKYRWEKFFPYPAEHYGWVVEIDPKTGVGKKHTSMGRFSHESATVTVASDGRCVVYSGDDRNDEHLYKFIADKPGSLDTGKLYVANFEKKKWVSLQREDHKILQKLFKNQLEIMIYTRTAAKAVGATPLGRPEDIEVDENTKNVFVALSNNFGKGEYFGQILKVEEKDGDPLSLSMKGSYFAVGGEKSGWAAPDNLVFDNKGNLWMVTDMSGSLIGKKPYKNFGNNGLFKIPMTGPDAGKAIQMGSAPKQAEFTGPCFSPDFKTLFLSVQHPGEKSKSLNKLKSNWPDGGIPKPAVVAINLDGQ
jgi:secreted PhoX family phosphatase